MAPSHATAGKPQLAQMTVFQGQVSFDTGLPGLSMLAVEVEAIGGGGGDDVVVRVPGQVDQLRGEVCGLRVWATAQRCAVSGGSLRRVSGQPKPAGSLQTASDHQPGASVAAIDAQLLWC